MLDKNGIIIADNVLYKGYVMSDYNKHKQRTAVRGLREFLKNLNINSHKSIIIVTHDMDVVGEFAKRVVVLNKGQIKFDGNKDDLFVDETCVLENSITT